MSKTIYGQLTKPKTACVVPNNQLTAELNYFKEAMRRLGNVKFDVGGGGTGEGSHLRLRQGYTYPNGLNRYHLKIVPRSLKILMTSGILTVWKKWENFRQNFKHQQRVVDQTKKVTPLAFEGSDVYLAFCGLLIGFLTASVTFFGKQILEFSKRT